jgi:hypothetical protein
VASGTVASGTVASGTVALGTVASGKGIPMVRGFRWAVIPTAPDGAASA